MAVLHVRGVPDDLYERIRAKAKRERRSLSGEIILLLEGAMTADGEHDPALAAFHRRADALAHQHRQLVRRREASTLEEQAALWQRIDARREALRQEHGLFPDSAALLRTDRDRDG